MSPSEVSKIVEDQINGNWERSNLHGVDLRKCLLIPERKVLFDARDNSAREMWLVLEEQPVGRTGYKIVFDEEERQFGLAIPGQAGRDVFLGFYGTFLDTFDGM